MSRRPAPPSAVTMPTVRGRNGSGRLRAVEQALRPESLLELLEGELQCAGAARLISSA